MASNFPSSDDVFTEPSSPGSTALSSAGTGSRTHTQHHRDLGDAVEAIEANVPILNHDHSGSGPRATSKLAQANTHESPDTDAGPTSLHHTLGTGANQAAAGNHTHTSPWPIGSIFMAVVSTNPNTLLGFGTWVALEDRFLIGVGALSNGATGGNSSITLTTNQLPSHTHTGSSLSTSSSGSHTHTFSATTSSDGAHTHLVRGDLDGAAWVSGGAVYSLHIPGSSGGTQQTASSSGAHTHTVSGTTGSDGSHTHTISGDTGSTGSGASVNILPPYLAVYMWKRTA